MLQWPRSIKNVLLYGSWCVKIWWWITKSDLRDWVLKTCNKLHHKHHQYIINFYNGLCGVKHSWCGRAAIIKGFDNDGHKPWRPQTMTMMTTTMTATNHDDQRHNLVKFIKSWIWRFLKSMPLVFHVFIAVAIMVYLVGIVVCGHHSCGRHGLWPSWYRPIINGQSTQYLEWLLWMATYSNIIIRRLQAGKASFDAWCHDAEYKEADSTDKAPAPHTKLHIHASTTAHTQPDVQSHCSTFMPRLHHTHTTRCTESLLHSPQTIHYNYTAVEITTTIKIICF